MGEALIIVDLQPGFLTKETEHLSRRINNLVINRKFDLVIASKFVNTPDSPFVQIMNWTELMNENEEDLDFMIKDVSDMTIKKNIYTAVNGMLLEALEVRNIDTVFIVGIDTDCCVLKTAVDLFEKNIKPVVLSDYCASTGGKESHNAGLKVLERLIGKDNVK